MSVLSFAVPFRRVCLATALVLFASLAASAQFDAGTITGLVTDPSGAAVAHATIAVTNIGTGFQKTLQTDARGGFTASSLPIGNYTVAAKTSGFAEAQSQTLVLSAGATVNVNLSLSVEAAKETVEVTGTTTTVDSGSSTAGTTLNSTQLSNLPVNGRDVTDFLEIAPGSVNSIGPFSGKRQRTGELSYRSEYDSGWAVRRTRRY